MSTPSTTASHQPLDDKVEVKKLILEMDWSDTGNFYRTLIESLPIAIYTCTNSGHINFYNEAAATLWGRHPELNKDRWCGSWKIYEPDGITLLPLEECPMAIALKDGREIYGKEIIVERPDGTRRNIMPHPRPVFDITGKQSGAVNMLIDITEKKLVEDQTDRLAAIVQSSEDAIISKTMQGVITSWNSAAERLFGYTAEEMLGEMVTKLMPPDRLGEELKILERLERGERVEHFETKRVTKTGKILDISLTISPIRDKNGKIIGASKITRNITEQKSLNRALLESEERLRLSIQSTQLGTWEYNIATGSFTWSDQCCSIYGIPPGMPVDYVFFLEHIHPEDRPTIEIEIQKALDPASDGNYETQYRILRHNDRQVRWLKVHGKVYFTNKQPQRFIGTALDITKEKIEQQELKNSVELFQTMADNAPAMIWMAGSDKFNDYFNRTWLEFTGKTIEEEGNDNWLKGVHPDDRQKCTEIYTNALKNKTGFYTEYRLLRHDGEYRWISDNCVPRYSLNGEFIGFISACIDIDDQKMFREKIMESELLFKTISNASPVGLWMTDTNARNIFVNDTWIEWTGIPFEKQLGNGWMERVVEEDRIATPAKFWDSLLKREKFTTEFRIIRQDGELRWCLTEGYPYYDISGEFAGYAGSVTDITELKNLERRKDDFIKMASHELKTPITSIKGYVQLMMNIYNEMNEERLQMAKPTIRSSLNTISKQVSKLTRLISELLDMSRIESGKLELHKSEFDPGLLVEETVEEIGHSTSTHAIIIENDFESKIYADRDRIGQVLLNLLTNAIKYSPKADNVHISLKGTDKMLIVSITDHGIGMDKKECSRIFERFYRIEGKDEQTYPGFGIGLFIANEIITRHDGTIAVESEKNKGSIFTFTLPAIKKN